MKAMVFHTHGGPEVLAYEEVPTPAPGPEEALVRVHATTVNRGPDTKVREDGFGVPGFRLPHVGGADGAGEIVALGPGVTGRRLGERVAIYPLLWCGACDFCRAGAAENYCRNWRMMGMHRWGAHAEYVAMPVRNLLPLPDGVGHEAAATLGVSYGTAHHGLARQVRVAPGETLLVMAGGSGVGAAAVQIGVALGARVLVTSGAGWKRARALELGAAAAFDYRDPSWPDQVRAATDGRGVDVVFDNIGAETWNDSLALLDRAGRMLCSGSTGGWEVPLDLRGIYRRMLELRFHMQGGVDDMRDLIELLDSGAFAPVIDSTLPLSETARAQERLAAQEQFGKVVLVPDSIGPELAATTGARRGGALSSQEER
ncbi:MAG TPA: zinc-binding dehydrogenase [Solirubrobacterales bacterium]|nr:zinc-binding dehydrogenase [Solirubrobacterales bacterium]